MKAGKNVCLNNINNIRRSYGTVDFVTLKSIFIKLESWVEPKNNDDFFKIINRLKNDLKKNIYENENDFFMKESIIDFDLRTKGVKKNKNSFMSIEITLFTKEKCNIKEKHVNDFIDNLTLKLIDLIINKNIFNFHLTKN
jgi:hypothetical protein